MQNYKKQLKQVQISVFLDLFVFWNIKMTWNTNIYWKLCLFVFFVIYPTCKTHTPHYIAICDLTCCTTLFYKRHDFRKKRSTHYVLIFSTRWSETLQVHSAAHCHECTEAFMKCLVILWVFNSSWIFYVDVWKMFKNPSWWMPKHLETVCSYRTERLEETSIRFY